MARDTKLMHVLLVEDNPGDVLLTEEALAASTINITLTVMADGESALAFLRADPGYEERVRPDLVLLDLNLPGTAGNEVLSHLKEDAALRAVPVVVLSSSRVHDDVLDAYERYANTYVAKPMRFGDYSRVIRFIEDYWFRAAELPSPSS